MRVQSLVPCASLRAAALRLRPSYLLGTENAQHQGFLAKLRSSPRRRRRLAWLLAAVVVLAVIASVFLLFPSSGGTPTPAHSESEYGTGTFWLVASFVLGAFLLALVYGVLRFLWRLYTGDVDEGAGSDGWTWRNPRRDLEEAMFPGGEPH
jgi:hypothetical protein